jgi:hypothetical protein
VRQKPLAVLAVVAALVGGAAGVLRAPAPAPAAALQVPAGCGDATVTAAGLRCTHPDTKPAGRVEQGGVYRATTGPAHAVPCVTDGSTGNRIQALYVREQGTADRWPSVGSGLLKAAAVANGVYWSSSGGKRQLRFVTDSACRPTVERLTVTASQARSMGSLTDALRARGYSRPDRKYLVWMDNTRGCGIAEEYLSDARSTDNPNNDGDMIAVVYRGCWGGIVEAHELTHTLGAVQRSAPHSTGVYGHCTDSNEVMCYVDGSGKRQVAVCSSRSDAPLLDCGRDDYFSMAPRSGGYLSQHWNVATNSFLVGGGPAIPIPPSAVGRTTATTSGTKVTLAAAAPAQRRSGLSGYRVVDTRTGSTLWTGTTPRATVTLVPWRTYRLVLVAYNAYGEGPDGNGVTVTVGVAPVAPAAPQAAPSPNADSVGVALSWPAVPHATGYRVLRDGVLLGMTGGTSWRDAGPFELGRSYAYTLVAINAYGASAASPVRSFRAL